MQPIYDFDANIKIVRKLKSSNRLFCISRFFSTFMHAKRTAHQYSYGRVTQIFPRNLNEEFEHVSFKDFNTFFFHLAQEVSITFFTFFLFSMIGFGKKM